MDEEVVRGPKWEIETLEPMSGEEFTTWLNSDSEGLYNKRITEPIRFNGENLVKKYIANCAFEDGLEINVNNKEGAYLSFDYCLIKGQADFFTNTHHVRWVFNTCKFHDVEFYSCVDGSISVINCDVGGKLVFQSVKDAQINLDDIKVLGSIKFINLKAEYDYSTIRLTDIICSEMLNISSDRIIKEFKIFSGSFGSINISAPINQLEIGQKEVCLNATKLNLSGYNYEGEVFIRNVRLDHLVIDDIVGDNTSFEIMDTAINKRWSMTNSAPEYFYVLNLTCCQLSQLYFDNSLLAKCTFSNITWPKRNLLQSKAKDEKVKHRVLREAYRQLKQAMLKDGNNIDALSFYRNELEEYRAFVKGNNDVKREDKIILWMMRTFSDHGQSFARPIAWLIGVHLVFFLLMILANYHGYYFTTNHDWSVVPDLIGEYLTLLNPAHRSMNISGWQEVIDFLMRLSSGFFIYHIIRASRKFAKV
ncbi:MAG: hypothetical protein GC178_00835 [Flavobacteriales bacterium]|nr:hypothetical protein [Flavobacteriales bacterium]